MKRLIVTADDFGLAEPVNEAVEQAHTRGFLTSASLMVTAPATADAVARARRLPDLGVGLHLVLLNGIPASAPEQIQDLVGADGRFTVDPVRLGIKLFFLPGVQRQVEMELRAQFVRFQATGLGLDHVDGHLHFHQHPTIVGMLVRLAGEFGVRAVRVPHEPLWPSWRAQRNKALWRALGWLFDVTRFTGMKRRLRRAGIVCNDHIFGLYDSGRMTPARIDRFLAHLPEGVSELYCHPATRRWPGIDNLPEHYQCIEEFQALAEPARARGLREAGVECVAFGALGGDVAD